MAQFTPYQQVALNLPPLSDPVAYNTVSIPLATFIQNLLDSNNGVPAQALASCFQMLMQFDRLIREQWGEYEYTLRTNMTFADAYRHWTYVAVTGCFNDPGVVPQVSTNSWYGVYPITGLNGGGN